MFYISILMENSAIFKTITGVLELSKILITVFGALRYY